MTDISELPNYIKGLAKASFCKPIANQQYISLAHFLSLQPRECMKIKDEYYPDMMITTCSSLPLNSTTPNKKILYIWLPTPPKEQPDQVNYAKECRKRFDEVLPIDDTQHFDEVWLDVRGNIGGVLSTVVDAVYPILAKYISNGEPYLTGVNKYGKSIMKFEISTKNNIKHVLNIEGERIMADILPFDQGLANKFDGKPINILCNRYTMSTGEIMCIIVRKLGGKVYGEQTRGLTNGMEIVSNPQVEYAYVPYYYIADGNNIYYDGVKPCHLI